MKKREVADSHQDVDGGTMNSVHSCVFDNMQELPQAILQPRQVDGFKGLDVGLLDTCFQEANEEKVSQLLCKTKLQFTVQ